MTTPSRPRASSSTPSSNTLSQRASVRSRPGLALPPIVVTSPPWAKDEPPSPTQEHPPTAALETDELLNADTRFDVASMTSSNPGGPSRWWAFTLPRPSKHDPPSSNSSFAPKPERKPHKQGSMSITWRPKEIPSFTKRSEKLSEEQRRKAWDLSIAIPAPVIQQQHSFTINQNQTPGWETPWTSRPDAQGPRPSGEDRDSDYGLGDEESLTRQSVRHETTGKRRKRKFRAFILTHPYVPLLFRMINMTFTSAALGLAIKIRQWEQHAHVMGAVGSSPTLVIIFAPLTLAHVIIAIYLEYFGRPLGLWRTSAKLAHTLLETIFICAWSAALSLCFDNYFTSSIPCTPWSRISWYNELPQPEPNLPTFEGSIGDRICESQLALICLVFVGALMYCMSLVISLYRIFEKVKYSPHPGGRRP